MGVIEGNLSVAVISGEISIIDSGENTTINTYVLQIIRFFENHTQIILLIVISDIMLAIGMVANLLLIFYILRHKRHKSSIFALILCLAVCDFSTCSASIFRINIFSSLVKPGYLCPIAIFYIYISFLANAYHLVTIAIIRFYQLVYPLSARAQITPSLCFKMSLIIWILAIPYAIPFACYYLWVVVTYNGGPVTMCFYTGDPAFREAIMAILAFSLPTFLTIIFHAAKHCIVSQQNESSQLNSSGQENKRQTTDARAVMTVITVAIISNLPSIIHRGMHGIFKIPYLPQHVFVSWIFDKVSFVNSITNPFIYVFASQSVRADLEAMFKN